MIDEKRIAARANNILKKENLLQIPVDVEELATRSDIKIEYQDMPSFSGGLVRAGNKFGILVSTSISNKQYQRFTIGHELGHYYLDGHPEIIFKNGDIHNSRSGFKTVKDTHELEADYFASSLLMPRDLFNEEMKSLRTAGLSSIKTLAEKFNTSLLATAFRYRQYSGYPTAIIQSEKGIIDFAFFSPQFQNFFDKNNFMKGKPIPESSLTNEYQKNPSHKQAGERLVFLSDWFPGELELSIVEEVIGGGQYNKYLTILMSTSPQNY